MMSSDYMWINGREVSLDAVQHGEEIPGTAFEKTTFDFIQRWLNGEDHFIVTTSGSTGTPKAIRISRQQMIASAQRTIDALQLKPGMTSLLCIDTGYIGGKMMIVRTLINGMFLFAVDPQAHPLLKIPVDQCVNFAAFVPYQIQQMLGSKHPHLLDNVDAALIGGASLPEDCVTMLQKLNCRFFATYGMTETISHIALRQLNGKHAIDFFQCLPGIELAVDDRKCLIVKAPYLNEPVTTNDHVELLNNRRFRWIGRWDNVINTGGVKVSPEKIEAIVQPLMHEAGMTNRFFIHGIEDHRLGSKVCLIIESADTSVRKKLEVVLSKLSTKVSPYEMPREVLIVPTIVLTENGKINRSASVQKTTTSFPIKK